jgi:hypothetical protein
MERRNQLRTDLFDRVTQDHVVHHFPKPGMEKLARETWKEHGVCPNCNRWSISDGRCCCGWKSESYLARVKAIADAKAKHEQDIADQIAEHEEYLAALEAKNRGKKGSK